MPKSNNAASALPIIHIVEFITLHSYIPYFMEALEHIADGVRSYEKVEDSGEWVISLHFNKHPDIGHLKSVISELATSIGLDAPVVSMHEAENKNWVEELSKNFKPINAGKFYIFSEFSEPSNELIDIKINPGMAFGTGQHETTYLCLEALQYLESEKFTPQNILDLGCGSGILAIAAAKTWQQTITASDNDPIAVRVADENSVVNSVTLECFVSEGFELFKKYEASQSADPELVSGSANGSVRFDLIFANILMNPLLEMAEDMAVFASDKVILSGFKTDQVEAIMEKYTSLGFKSERIFVRNHWVAVLLSKK